MQFHPLIRHCLDVVEGTRAARMAGNLKPLIRRKAAKNLLPELGGSGFQLVNLVRHIHFVLGG